MTIRNAQFHNSGPKIVRATAFFPSVCLLLAMVALPAAATTISFDDIDASAGDIPLAGLNPYQGYNWTNFSAYTTVPGFPGFNNGIVSGPNAAYTAGDALGSPLISTITAATGAFNFISGSFGSGWYDGLNVTFNGLSNGTTAFTQTITLNTKGSQFFTFNFTGITELDIFSSPSASTSDPYGCGPSGCSQITLDDVTLTPAPTSPNMPEPMTFALAGIGILILALRRLRSTATKSV